MAVQIEPIEMAANLLVLIMGIVVLAVMYAESRYFKTGRLHGIFSKGAVAITFFFLNFLFVDGIHTLEPFGINIVTSAAADAGIELLGHIFQIAAFLLVMVIVFEFKKLRK